MLKTVITALLAAGLVLLGACTTSPTGRSQLAIMPDSQLDQMGLQAFDTLKTKKPPLTDNRINGYVHCVADAITRGVGGGAWEVAVFDDKTPNAFALPGGKIGVHSGLLNVAQNQHQLAAVIGHEVAHVIARHSNERVSQEFAVQSGMSLIQALGAPQSGMGQMLMGLLGAGAQVGILLPYSRLHESEADTIGLDYMAQAGFDPRQSIDLWVNMERAGSGQPIEFLSTHPSHSTRLQELNSHMPRAMQLRQQALAMGKNPQCDQYR